MRKIFSFLKPYYKQTIAMILCLFIQGFGTLYIPTLTADIVDNGIIQGNLDYIWKIGTLMIIVALIIMSFSIFGTYLSSQISAYLGRDFRNALFKKTQKLSIEEFNEFGAASMISRNTSDVTKIQEAFSSSVEMLLPAPFMAIAGLVLTFSKDTGLAISILGIMLVILLLAFLISKKAIPLLAKQQTLFDKMNKNIREKITGVRVIRAFNRMDYEKSRMDNSFVDYNKTAISINKLFAILMPIITLIMNISTLVIVYLGNIRVASGTMQLGDIIAVIGYSSIILMAVIMGLAGITSLPKAKISADRILAVLNVDEDQSIKNEISELPEAAEVIKFDNVSFGYANAEEKVLEDISFSVKKGQTTAIVGSTGSGKSTIASLLMGFYSSYEGDIFYKGESIANISSKSLRNEIGYVPQKAFLFSGTIVDNLRHGKKDATDSEINHACKIAQVDDYITSLDEGLETPVAQGGNNFSGGQKQRLAIARALIKKPELYVFDDSFSALDYKTDARLRALLKKETSEAAMIIVAQRINTIIDADQIIVLDEGKIAGIGTHQTLLKTCLPYQQIVDSQLSKEDIA
jgi:ATP-binding cassette subfamily B multidrug efflux pump